MNIWTVLLKDWTRSLQLKRIFLMKKSNYKIFDFRNISGLGLDNCTLLYLLLKSCKSQSDLMCRKAKKYWNSKNSGYLPVRLDNLSTLASFVGSEVGLSGKFANDDEKMLTICTADKSIVCILVQWDQLYKYSGLNSLWYHYDYEYVTQ